MPFRTPPLSRRNALRAMAATTASFLAPASASLLAPAAALGTFTGPARAETAPHREGVTVRNQSVAPSCNGPENVALTLLSQHVRRFRVEARHPTYVYSMVSDRSAPSYLSCPPEAEKQGKAEPATAARRVTLYETPDLMVVGYTVPHFWRHADVPFRIGDQATRELDKVEVWLKPGDQGASVLELFLADGSWRLRPLPPQPLASTAFGASVLIGPVAQGERLLVKLREVEFAPEARSFTLHFAAAGTAEVVLAGADTEALRLDVHFSEGTRAPFAALRAHYVTESEADITRLAWRKSAQASFGEAPVMAFDNAAEVTLLWAGRLAPARPALTAPDLVFSGFSGT